MAAADILQIINHYKKDIQNLTAKPERALKYEDRLLHCLGKLHKLPVTVQHLQDSGVGRTVNALRKIQGKKGLSEAAKALVAKWKTMVIREDQEEEEKKIKQSEGIKKQASYPSPVINSDMSYCPENSSQQLESSSSYSPSKIGSETHKSDEYSPGDSNDIAIYCYSPTKKKEEIVKEEKTDEKRRDTKSHSRSKKDKEHKSDRASSHSSKLSGSAREHRHENSKQSSSSKSGSSKSSSSKSSSSNTSKKRSASDQEKEPKGTSFADSLGPMIIKKCSSGSPRKKVKTESEEKEPVKTQAKEEIPGPSFLEPLDPEMFSTLSVPTPNYKPNPYNPGMLSPESVFSRKKKEEDALALMMSNKNSRTKVYSGTKTGLTYVPTLYEISCRVLQQHFDSLEYTGGVPYNLLKPVVDSATPSQLYRFEHYNPYILEDTDHLWKFHVNREFRGEQRDEYETWRDMYLRCVDEREEKYKSVTANIQKSLEKSVPVRQTKLAYVDVAKPPRAVLRAQLKNGTSKPDASRLMGKENPDAVRINPPSRPALRVSDIPPHLRLKPKVAPLMQKALKSIKQIRYKR